MPGFTDLVETCQPYYCEVDARFTAGQTLARRFLFRDRLGEPVDFTGVTGVCQIVDYANFQTVILALDVTLSADGWVTVGKPAASFPSSLAGSGVEGERYRWRLTLTKESTGESCSMWGPAQSTVTVVPA